MTVSALLPMILQGCGFFAEEQPIVEGDIAYQNCQNKEPQIQDNSVVYDFNGNGKCDVLNLSDEMEGLSRKLFAGLHFQYDVGQNLQNSRPYYATERRYLLNVDPNFQDYSVAENELKYQFELQKTEANDSLSLYIFPTEKKQNVFINGEHGYKVFMNSNGTPVSEIEYIRGTYLWGDQPRSVFDNLIAIDSEFTDFDSAIDNLQSARYYSQMVRDVYSKDKNR